MPIKRPAQNTQRNTTRNGRSITVLDDRLKPTPRIPVATSKVNTTILGKPARGSAYPLA